MSTHLKPSRQRYLGTDCMDPATAAAYSLNLVLGATEDEKSMLICFSSDGGTLNPKVEFTDSLTSFRWMTCNFTFFSPVFQLYLNDGQVIMNG